MLKIDFYITHTGLEKARTGIALEKIEKTNSLEKAPQTGIEKP